MQRYLMAGKPETNCFVIARKRLPQFANVPTFWELGDRTSNMLLKRGDGWSARQYEREDYREDNSGLFRTLFHDPNGQNYRKRVGLVGEFKPCDQSEDLLDQSNPAS